MRHPRGFLECAAAAAIFVTISLANVFSQRPEQIFGDAGYYYNMEKQFELGATRVKATEPFVYRIGTPWLASVLSPLASRLTPLWLNAAISRWLLVDRITSFYVVNIGSAFVALMLLIAYLRRFVDSAGVRLLLVTMWMTEWWAPVRYVYFYPINIEPLFLCFVLAGLLIMETARGRPHWRTVTALTVIVFLGTLVRESAIMVAFTFLVWYRAKHGPAERTWSGGVSALAPLLASIAALACARVVGLPIEPHGQLIEPRAPWSEAVYMWQSKPVFTWVLAWFFAFGPASIALVAAAVRQARAFLIGRPDLALYLAGCGVLAYFGGTDTERILGWAAPVVYVLIGRAIEHNRRVLSRSAALVGSLCVTQIVSARILWPIPLGVDNIESLSTFGRGWPFLKEVLNRLFVIDTHYVYLWSYFGSHAVHACNLALDVMFVVTVLFVIGRLRHRPDRVAA